MHCVNCHEILADAQRKTDLRALLIQPQHLVLGRSKETFFITTVWIITGTFAEKHKLTASCYYQQVQWSTAWQVQRY